MIYSGILQGLVQGPLHFVGFMIYFCLSVAYQTLTHWKKFMQCWLGRRGNSLFCCLKIGFHFFIYFTVLRDLHLILKRSRSSQFPSAGIGVNQRCEAEMETVRDFFFLLFLWKMRPRPWQKMQTIRSACVRVWWWGTAAAVRRLERWMADKVSAQRFQPFFPPLGGKCPEQISSDRCYTSRGAKDRGYRTPLNYSLSTVLVQH